MMVVAGRRLISRRTSPRRFETLEARQLLAGDATLVADEFVARQNATLQRYDVLQNDQFSADYDGPQQITSVSFGSQGGRIEIADDGKAVLYAPPADFAGLEKFSYFVDGQYLAEVDVMVQSPLRDDQYTLLPDGQWHTLDVLANDPFWPDYQGDRRITLTSVNSRDAELELSPDGQSIRYRASQFDPGVDRFVYIVDDLYSAAVAIEVPHVLESDGYEVLEDAAARRYSVLSNDFGQWRHYDGPKQITAVVRPDDGSESSLEVSGDGSALIYEPASDFSGHESFRYVVDGRFEARVNFRVISPVVDDGTEVDRNSQDFAIDVISNDRYYSSHRRRWVDVVNRVTSVEATSEQGGSVEVLSSTQVAYTPPNDFEGLDTFSYTADGRYEATVSVNVTRPVRNDFLTVYQDIPNQRLGVLSNDFLGNGYGGPKQITDISETAEGVTITRTEPGLQYTPPALFTGSDTFTYTVDQELEADVSLYVAPLAIQDSFSDCAAPNQSYRIYPLQNDNFRHGYNGPTQITSLDLAATSGNATIGDNGRYIVFTPNGRARDRLKYTVDGTYQADVSINLSNHLRSDTMVAAQNDGEQSIDVLENDFEYETFHCPAGYQGPGQITGVSQSEQGGSVRLADDGRTLLYQPAEDFYGRDAFTYTVDNLMTATVSVDVVRYVRDDQYRVDPDGQATLPVLANDLFSGYRGVQQITDVTSSDVGASVTIGSDGKHLNYVAAPDFVGTDRLTYTVDGRLKAEVEVVVQDAGSKVFPRFESVQQLQDFLIDDALERYDHLFGQPAYGFPYRTEGGALDNAPQTDAGRDFSETNVQVEGIDEADLMEFDADYLYMITGNDVVILDAWPAEQLAEVSRITIEGQVFGQFLNGDRLTVISEQTLYDSPWPVDDLVGAPRDVASDVLWWPPYQVDHETLVTVLDVSDRTAPTVIQQTTLQGRLVQTRAIDNYVYVAVNNRGVAPQPERIEQNDGSFVYETRDAYLQRMTMQPGLLLDESLPNYASVDSAGDLVRSGLTHEPEDLYQPIADDATNIVSLVSFNVDSDEPGLAATSGVYTHGGAQVYASHEHFYVFESVHSEEDGLGTQILQFDWDATNGSAEFSAAGYVAGRMLNQFSADEYEGHLRVATTINNSSGGNASGITENDLFILRDNGGIIEMTGSLQNLALRESIRSVRFMGPRAFMVTFREVDPLFGLDVSDPSNPEAVGHLTLPGFSSYMQLIDETHLLTVGNNNGPTQVSLFDVKDLTQPVRIDEYTFQRFSVSEAEADHHAFGYYGRHGMLAVPVVRSYAVRSDEDDDGYAETRTWVTDHQLTVLEIDASAEPGSNQGVTLATEITHASPVRRSGYIEDKLFSIAEDSVHVVDVARPTEILATADQLRPDVEPKPPVPIWPEGDLVAMTSAAQTDLATRLNVAAQAVLPITVERQREQWQTVVRVGETYYRYAAAGDDGRVELLEEDFRFDHDSSIIAQNQSEPLDVNADQDVAPSDAVLIVEYLTRPDSADPTTTVVRQVNRRPAMYLDVSGDGTVSALDALLVAERLEAESSLAVDTGTLDSNNPDSLADVDAVEALFANLLSVAGDANRDGQFDSSDLVEIFQHGRYESDQPATWNQGDWDGDSRFSTSDLVFAFTVGKYQS